jgi:hypothetical protein
MQFHVVLRAITIAAFAVARLSYAESSCRGAECPIDEFQSGVKTYDEDVVMLLQTATYGIRRGSGETKTLAEAARMLEEDTLALHKLMAQQASAVEAPAVINPLATPSLSDILPASANSRTVSDVATLKQELQTVLGQRDTALTEMQKNKESINYAKKELELALAQSRQAMNVINQKNARTRTATHLADCTDNPAGLNAFCSQNSAQCGGMTSMNCFMASGSGRCEDMKSLHFCDRTCGFCTTSTTTEGSTTTNHHSATAAPIFSFRHDTTPPITTTKEVATTLTLAAGNSSGSGETTTAPLPKTTLSSAAKAGDTSLEFASAVGFQVGQSISIDEGTDSEEVGVIANFTATSSGAIISSLLQAGVASGTFGLTKSLLYDHASGASVRALPAEESESAVEADDEECPPDVITFHCKVSEPVGYIIWAMFISSILCCCAFLGYQAASYAEESKSATAD